MSESADSSFSLHPSSFAPAGGGGLLRYRPWRGQLAGSGLPATLGFLALQAALFALLVITPAYPVLRLILAAAFIALWGLVVYARGWPIARASLGMMLRRWLFWVVYVVTALPAFLFFFFTLYLFAWASQQAGTEARMGGLGRINPQILVKGLADSLKMNGSPETYRNFISYESWPVMIMLTLAGAMLIGNDIRHNSLPFYLSKPISRWDYLIGKGIAIAFVVNMITTVPALLLWLEHGMVKQGEYFLQPLTSTEATDILVGILGYGLVLTISLTTLLLATATWLRKTVPLIMAWTILFVFCGLLSDALVHLGMGAEWRLFNLWNCTYVVGNACLGIAAHDVVPQPQPHWYEAALVLIGVSVACLTYLILRIRAVDVVR